MHDPRWPGHVMRLSLGSRVDRTGRLKIPGSAQRPEAGDTLIEVLLAITVLGIAALALLAAFATSLSASSGHRSLATTDTVLKSASEDVVAQIQNGSAPFYQSCASAAFYQAAFANANGGQGAFNNLPAGYSAVVTGVQFWDTSQNPPIFDSTCPVGSLGPQLVTITVTSPDSSTFTISTVVDDPTARPIPPYGVATKLAFTTSPSGASGGLPFASQPVVVVEDTNGNPVRSDLSNVTLAIVNPQGATLSNNCTGSEFYGVVTFSNCSINLAGTYQLLATDSNGSLTPATSDPFTVSVGAPALLKFTTQPGGGTGGTAWSTGNQPVVTVEDAGGNVVTGDASTVTLAISPGTPATGGPGNLSGCSQSESSGVVTFSDCKINTQGTGYTLTATDGFLASDTSSTFNVTVGAAYQVAFTASPGASTTGATFGVQPVVTVEDAGGNAVNSSTASVTLAINSGNGTLGCNNNPISAVGGVATFAGCKITLGTQGTFTLSATGLFLISPPAVSAPFTVAGTAVAKLAFATSPGASTGGTAFSTQPAVWVEDSSGDLITTNSSTSVTLSINSGTGTLGCSTNPRTAANGVVTFSNCKITLGTQGVFKLTATAASISVTSAPFTVAGTATQLVFTTPPGNGTGGSAFGTQPVVTVEDSSGDVVTANTSAITLAITGGTGPSGAILTCSSNPVAASAGVATFAGCAIDKSGNGYTLTATLGGPALTGTSTPPFNVTVGPAAQLVFTTQPGNGTGGTALATQPVVTVEDAGGNAVTNDASTVTLSIASGTPATGGPGNLSGCSGIETSGVTTFNGCSIDAAGTGYSLTAGDGALSSITSSTFNVTVGPAAQLAFTTSPGASTTATDFATQPVVTVQDAGGNTVASSAAPVTLAINSGAGTLSCTSTLTVAAVNGVATFAGCKITIGTQGQFTLKANATGLTQGVSNSFTVAGPASELVFAQQPSNSTSAVAFGAQPIVWVADSSGDLVTTNTSAVTVAITSGTGTTGATVTCTTNPVTAVNGVAHFAGCSIIRAGIGYTLTATDGILSPGTSGTFTISAGPPTRLAFTTQPGGGSGGVAWAQQPVVTIEDANGNPILNDASTVLLAITSGTPTSGGPGTMSGCSQNESGGVVAFTGCSINTKGTAYQLTATDNGLAAATSTDFNIAVGPAAQLVFTTQPVGGVHEATNLATQPKVTVEDAGGNVVTTNTSAVNLGIATYAAGNGGTSQGTVACTTNPVNAVAGVATFAGCQIIGAAAAGTYTLSAGQGALAGTSSNVVITAGTANKLVFTTQPVGGVNVAATFATQPVVSVEDANGNVVTTDTGTVSVSIATYAGGNGGNTQGTVACTTNPVNAVAGVATFAGCQINGTAAAGTYTLSAARGGLTSGTSSNVVITAGTATKLAFTTQPTVGQNIQATGTGSFSASVAVQDSFGNTVLTDTSSITLAIGTNPSTGVLTCTNAGGLTVTASAGVANFTGCAITKVGTGYTLAASSSPVLTPPANANAFNITAGTATNLIFTTQPTVGQNIEATGTGTFSASVAVQDVNGNTQTLNASHITLAIGTNPGSGVLSCTNAGGLTVTASAGVANFTGCAITMVGTGYTLAASSSPVLTPPANANAFNITAGTATKLVFTTQPTVGQNIEATGTGSFAASVAVQDVNGNTQTLNTSSITLAIGTNPSTGVLTCTNPGGLTVTASAGVANFTGCAITKAGNGYTLAASSSPVLTPPANANAFNITAGTATQLVFTTQPVGGVNEATNLATQPKVTVEDVNGNVVTTNTSAVNLGIATYAAGNGGNTQGTLSCTSTTSVNAAAGVATFAGCQITGTAGAGTYTLSAGQSALAGTSSGVVITAGTHSSLAFTTQPTSGQNIQATGTGTFPVSVAVQDTFGNTVLSDTSSITLGIRTNPSTGVLTCTNAGGLTVSASAGVANFTGCAITKAGLGYTLAATSGPLTPPANANAFNITAGTASQLVFTAQAVGGVNEATNFATQPVVSVEDANSNVVTTDTSAVNLGIATYAAGNGGNTQGTLSCTSTTTVNAAAGVATFAGCQITGTAAAGTYTLSATRTGLTPGTSSGVVITTGQANQLSFTTQPTSGQNIQATGTASFSASVAVQDSSGNTVLSDTRSINLAIGTNPSAGVLSCTNAGGLTVSASAGVANFTGCAITKAGNRYTLAATSSPVLTPPANANAFNITPGAASKLVFTQQPSSSTGGIAFGTQPVVTVEDSNGNTVTLDSSTVNLGITAGTPASGGPGTVSGCSQSEFGGVVTFSGCSINTVGTGYKLHATDTDNLVVLTAADSATLNITLGPAAQVAFTTQPVGGVNEGTNFATQPKVSVEDAGGNVVTTDTRAVTLGIATYTASNGGNRQGTLSCTASTTTVNAVAGMATFSGCQITGTAAAGTYTLSATAGGLSSGTSSNVVITAGPHIKLVFTVQPTSGQNIQATGTGSFPISVAVQDVNGNTVLADTSSITLAIGTNPSGGVLTCTNTGGLTVTAVSGVANFTGCAITKVGNGYNLTATSAPSLNVPAVANSFNITVGAASRLVFTQQPGNSTGGVTFATQPGVTVEDVDGNTVTSAANGITLVALNAVSQGALLSCTANPLTPTSGVSSFAGCKINAAGTYTLIAVDVTDGIQGTSSALTISVGSATQIGFTQQPSGAPSSGGAFPTQPQVAIEDAGGNTVTLASATITLTLQGSGGTLGGCTKAVNTSSGVATFGTNGSNNCKVKGTPDIVDDNFLATATGGFGTVTSSPFNITGAATKFAFLTQPGNETGGGNLSAQPQVVEEDATGNVVTGAAATNVTLAIGTNPGGGTLLCNTSTTSVATSYGMATFAGCGVSQTGSGYTLTATGSLTIATSAAFNVTSISAPTITYPTTANPLNPGLNGTATYALSGANFASGVVASISAGVTGMVQTWINANIITLMVTGTGGSGTTGNVTVTNPDGGAAAVSNGFRNGP